MRKIHSFIVFLVLMGVLILTGCEKTSYFIDWRTFTPKKEMVMYFDGGFEMGGHITAIEHVDEHSIIKREMNDGATAWTLDKIYDGLAVRVLNHMPENVESFSLDKLLTIPYTQPDRGHLVYETRNQKWEETNSDGIKVQKEVLSMNYPIEINGEPYSGVKIRETEKNENDAHYVVDQVYVKDMGRVSTEFIYIDERCEEEILHYERLLRVYDLDKKDASRDLKETVTHLKLKYKMDFILPNFYGSPYDQSYIFGMNPVKGLTKNVSYKNVVLDYQNKIFKSFDNQYDEVLNDFSYVYDTVSFNQSGNLSDGMLVYVQKPENEGISLYLFKGHAPIGTGERWTLVDDFKKPSAGSQKDLSPDALTAILIGEDILYYKEGTLNAWHITATERSVETYDMPNDFSLVTFYDSDGQICLAEKKSSHEKLIFNRKEKNFEIVNYK